MNIVFTLNPNQIGTFLEYYQEELVQSLESHVLALIHGVGYTIHVYRSNKVLIQGEEAKQEALYWQEFLGIPIDVKDAKATTTPHPEVTHDSSESHFGSDEVGTGDFFGPVVVVCAHVSPTLSETLLKLGVKDSKKLTDDQIKRMAEGIIHQVPHEVVILPNPKYNEMIAKGFNQNKIKAYLHNHAIRKALQLVKQSTDPIIIDEFTPQTQYFAYLADYPHVVKQITFVQKAESQYLAVAAASILARYYFLEEMDKLSASIAIELPKGSGIVVDLIGKRIALQYGLDVFSNIAKIHFKNMERITSTMKS